MHMRPVQKVSRFEFPQATCIWFCCVMLVLMSLAFADEVSHIECLVNFWHIFCLDVFWYVFDFCLFQQRDQRICIKFCMKNKIKCADVLRMFSLVCGKTTLDQSKVYRWYKMCTKRCERQRAFQTHEYINNRRKHWWSQQNSIEQSLNHR